MCITDMLEVSQCGCYFTDNLRWEVEGIAGGMESVVERNPCAVAVQTVQDAASRWREVGYRESNAIAKK